MIAVGWPQGCEVAEEPPTGQNRASIRVLADLGWCPRAICARPEAIRWLLRKLPFDCAAQQGESVAMVPAGKLLSLRSTDLALPATADLPTAVGTGSNAERPLGPSKRQPLVPAELRLLAGLTHSSSSPKAAARNPSRLLLRAAKTAPSDLGPFRNLQCVVDLDPEVSHGALQLDVTKQRQDRPQVLGSHADRRRRGSPHAVRPANRRIEPDGRDPLMHDAGILARGDVRRFPRAIGEQEMFCLRIRLFDPRCDRGSGRLGQLELHRPLRLSVHDHGPGQDPVAVHHVANAQVHQITAAKLVVDCQVEHGQVA